MADDRDLRTRFEADTGNLERGFKRAKDSAEDFGKGTESAAQKANDKLAKLSLLVTGGLAVGLAGAAKVAIDFEHGLSQVGAVAGATDAEMRGLRDTAIRLGADTQYSAGAMTGAMESLAANGITARDIMGGAADATAALAAAGGTDLTLAADTASTAMAVWGLKTSELTDVVNRLSGAANVSRFGVEDMSYAIARGGGAAATAGVEFGDYAAVIAMIAPSFKSGADAGTAVATMLTRMSPVSTAATKAMTELGIITADGSNKFFTASGELRSMAEITQVLHDATASLTEQEKLKTLSVIYGTDAMIAAAAIANNTAEDFARLDSTLGNTQATDVAAQRMDNVAGSLEQMKGSFETAGIVIGSKFLPIIGDMAGKMTEGINAFAAMDSGSQNLILGVVGITAALPAMIAGVSKASSGIRGLSVFLGTAQGKATLFAAGLGAAIIALDQISSAATGYGLTDRIFGDVGRMEAANAAMGDFAARMLAAGPEADRLAVATTALAAANNELVAASGGASKEVDTFTNIVAGSDGRIFGFNVGLSDGVDKFKQYEEAVKKAGAEMVGAGATVGELKRAYDELDPALQDAFNSTTNVRAGWEKYIEATDSAYDDFERAKFAQMGLTTEVAATEPAAAKAKTAIEKYAEAIGEGEDAVDKLQESLDGLTKTFSDQHPVADTLRASNAFLNYELGKLTALGDSATASEKARIAVLEKAIEKNNEQIAVYDRTQDAMEGVQEYMVQIIGPNGYGGLMNAMSGANLEADKQVTVLRDVASAFQHAAADDVPGMVGVLEALEETLKDQPEVWATVMEAMGPTLRTAIEDATPEARAAIERLGGDIVDGLANKLTTGANAISAAGRGMIRAALEEMREEAQTASPSKKTAEIGEDMTEGLILGLEKDIEKATNVLASAVEKGNAKAILKAEEGIAKLKEKLAQAKATLAEEEFAASFGPNGAMVLGSDGNWYASEKDMPSNVIGASSGPAATQYGGALDNMRNSGYMTGADTAAYKNLEAAALTGDAKAMAALDQYVKANSVSYNDTQGILSGLQQGWWTGHDLSDAEKDAVRSQYANLGKEPPFEGFAKGTNNAPGGWSWVGEQGPELMYVPRGSRVRSAAESGGRDQSVIVQFILDGHVVAEQMFERLMSGQRVQMGAI